MHWGLGLIIVNGADRTDPRRTITFGSDSKRNRSVYKILDAYKMKTEGDLGTRIQTSYKNYKNMMTYIPWTSESMNDDKQLCMRDS